MKFSVTYIPTTLFSLKDSNSTNSGAKSLFLPSPYAIKMAILNQAITIGGDLEDFQDKKSKLFSYIRDAKISFYIEESSYFSVNNTFIKILKAPRDTKTSDFTQTVAFREYVFMSNPIEIIFEVDSDEQKAYLQKYLHKINYFGKRGCFFQFEKYSEMPNLANVKPFDSEQLSPGILQEFDDFGEKVSFDNVNNYSTTKTERKKEIMILPLQILHSSKGFSVFKKI